ncbi:MAG: hypothetical protein ACJ8NS_04610 [Chthoniobacterales bacterium]
MRFSWFRHVRIMGALLAAITASAQEHVPAFRVKAPEGMKAVVTQNGDVVEIQFVPQDAVVAPAKTKVKTESKTMAAVTAEPQESAVSPARKQLDTKFSSLNLDRPISAVPAFTALDISPESVAHPASPRDFAAALLNGVDRQGVLQTGLAIETAPFRIIPGWKQDFPHYQTNYWTRFLYNFSLSLATAKASGDQDNKAVNLAVGVQTVLWESAESDPLRNPALQKAFHSSYTPDVLADIPLSGDINTETGSLAGAAKSFQAAVEEFRQRHWVGTLWTASVAPTWNSQSGKIGNLEGTGFAAWSTFAYAFDGPFANNTARFQALGQLRYRQGETVVDPNNSKLTAQQDSLLAAARLRVGSPDFNGFAEAGYLWIWGGLNGDGQAYRASIGLERRVAENVWLVLSGGQQFGGASSTDEFFALGTFRIGTADKPQLTPP